MTAPRFVLSEPGARQFYEFSIRSEGAERKEVAALSIADSGNKQSAMRRAVEWSRKHEERTGSRTRLRPRVRFKFGESVSGFMLMRIGRDGVMAYIQGGGYAFWAPVESLIV